MGPPAKGETTVFGSPVLASWVFLFVVSGIASPLLVTQVRYVYAPPTSTLWPLYPLYLGNLIAGAFSQPLPCGQWGKATRLFALDVTGQVFTNLGLLAVGPPLYSILYKSVTVFTGLLSISVLPVASHPTKWQWCAMLLITAGLGLQGVNAWQTLSSGQFIGAVLVLIGCVFFAGGAVASEMFLGVSGGQLGPLQAAWVIGVEGCVLSAAWAVAGVRGTPYGLGFWLLLGAMVVSSAFHQAAWFILVGKLGACTTAVLKAFQSVCVFLGASMAFCERDQTECFTREKMISFVIVSLGVLLYSQAARKPPATAARVDETSLIVTGRAAHG